jgi:hypothetical protein
MVRQQHGRRFGPGATHRADGNMHKELIVYLRMHAHDLVKLARRSSDEALSLELEKMAIEMLKRTADLERDSRI